MPSYGTVARSDAQEEHGFMDREAHDERSGLLVNRDKQPIWSIAVQRQRWRETIYYLIPMFLSACLLEGFNGAWRGNDDGNGFAYDMWVGFGAAIGGFAGRMIKMLLIYHEKDYNFRIEFDESLVIALSLLFGPSGSFYWCIYCAVEWNLSFAGAFFYVAAFSFLTMLGSPMVFRNLIHWMRGIRGITCQQTNLEFIHDVSLSLSVAIGFAFMLGTTNRVPGNWFQPLVVTDETPIVVAMLDYGFLFAAGFLLVQGVQNFVLRDSWTDIKN